MIIKRTHRRLAGLAVIGWIVLESLLFYASASTIGTLPTIAVLTLKGLGGLALLAVSLKSILRTMALGAARRGLSGAAGAVFSTIGAALIMLPGFLATFAGLALFSPSVRSAIVHRLWREKKQQGRDAIVSLDRREWSEVAADRPADAAGPPPVIPS